MALRPLAHLTMLGLSFDVAVDTNANDDKGYNRKTREQTRNQYITRLRRLAMTSMSWKQCSTVDTIELQPVLFRGSSTHPFIRTVVT